MKSPGRSRYAGQPPKRLTRLEQLRLEQEQREKEAAGQPAKKEEPKKP